MSDTIERKEQFPDTPSGWASRWAVEFEAEDKEHKDWRERGERVLDKYIDKDKKGKVALFHGDVETKKALLYGNPPQVRSRRRFADPDDKIARVSAEMQSRLLNTDIERDTDGFRTALGLARDDRLLPGLGVIRERYVVEWGDPLPAQEAKTDPVTGVEVAPAVPEQPQKSHEDVETDYVHWRDFKWGPARVWDEVNWVAFRAEMTREALHERFDSTIAEGDADVGARLVEQVPMNAKDRDRDEKVEDPWSRAAVWEIWCKQSREVFWYVEGFDRILDRKPDPLGLDAFWPCPKPLFANVTSRSLVPVPDYVLAQPLYEEIDNLSLRISNLEDAVRVTGVYDKNNSGLEKVVAGGGNKLYPIDNWAAYAERGGLAAGVELMPLEGIVKAIEILTAKRQEKIALLYQVTGMSDIMRGQASGPATATEQRIKARFGSTRVQAAQDEFARFTTDAQKIRAEIIAKHFDAQTIIERSNILRTKDTEMAQQAADLIKSDYAQYRIEVATDTLAMTDYDAVKQERVEVVAALGGLLQAGTPLVQLGGPPAMEFVLEAASWLIAGTKGGSSLEGVFDRFKSMVQQAAAQPKPPPPPDPKVEAAKIGLETKKFDAQAHAMGAKADMQKTMMEGQVAQMKGALDIQKLERQAQIEEVRASRPIVEEFPA